MPSMNSASVLTLQDHAHFLEHGYVVVKGVVSPTLIASAVEALEAGVYSGRVGDADYRPVRAEAVAECLTDTVRAAISELFGEAYPFDWGRDGTDMPRPYRPDAAWPPPRAHIDDDYPTLMPNGWALGMFLFLTPVRSHGGAFVLFPGSYRRYRKILSETPDGIFDSVANAHVAGDPQELLADPGDLLLFHHLMGHAGSENVADPRTRHALLARWHPRDRIVPGDKPFAAMSTLEKANSRRHQEGAVPGTEAPTSGAIDRAPGILIGGQERPDDLRTQTLLHIRGRSHLFCVDDVQPGVIQHAASSDLVHWDFGRPLLLPRSPITSLSLYQRRGDPLLLASVEGGITIYTSRDMEGWTDLGTVPGAACGAGHFNTNFGSAVARGHVLFYASRENKTEVRCRWAGSWEAIAGNAHDEAIVAKAPDGLEVAGLCLKPIFGEDRFALVVDLGQTAEPGSRAETQPYYSVSGDSASYSEPFRPLAYTTSTAPRALQVYRRARNYWLVTYLRSQDGRDQLFWGSIDWQQEQVTIEEIVDADQWSRALDIVGLR